jgi:hypothetical protein
MNFIFMNELSERPECFYQFLCRDGCIPVIIAGRLPGAAPCGGQQYLCSIRQRQNIGSDTITGSPKQTLPRLAWAGTC